MSYVKLLTDRCSIYKLQTRNDSGGYGVSPQEELYYNDTPDIVNIPCLFTEVNLATLKREPGVKVEQTYNVHFNISANVSLGDVLEWNGVKFKADLPLKPRNHHIEVRVVREIG